MDLEAQEDESIIVFRNDLQIDRLNEYRKKKYKAKANEIKKIIENLEKKLKKAKKNGDDTKWIRSELGGKRMWYKKYLDKSM